MSERSQRSLPGYLDFDLEIGSGSGREYPLTARSADGEARETLRFPFDELALENRLLALQNALLRSGGKRRQILSPEQQAVQTFGRALFDALFVGEVRGRYDLAQREAAREGKGLRVRLRIQPAALAALPWEFLYDPRSAEYVCLSAHTPLVRYIELPRPMQPLIVPPPLRILGLIASPAGLEPLDVTREQARVERAVAGLQERGLVELTWLPGARPGAISSGSCAAGRGTSSTSSATAVSIPTPMRGWWRWPTVRAGPTTSRPRTWAGCWPITARCGWCCSTRARARAAATGISFPARLPSWCAAACPP